MHYSEIDKDEIVYLILYFLYLILSLTGSQKSDWNTGVMWYVPVESSRHNTGCSFFGTNSIGNLHVQQGVITVRRNTRNWTTVVQYSFVRYLNSLPIWRQWQYTNVQIVSLVPSIVFSPACLCQQTPELMKSKFVHSVTVVLVPSISLNPSIPRSFVYNIDYLHKCIERTSFTF